MIVAGRLLSAAATPQEIPSEFEERIISRATRHLFARDVSLLTCRAEDLVVLKSFANRTKDWLDVEGVILRQGRDLDVPLILRELQPLIALKEEPEIRIRLEKLLASSRRVKREPVPPTAPSSPARGGSGRTARCGTRYGSPPA